MHLQIDLNLLESASIWHRKELFHATHYAKFPSELHGLMYIFQVSHVFFGSAKAKTISIYIFSYFSFRYKVKKTFKIMQDLPNYYINIRPSWLIFAKINKAKYVMYKTERRWRTERNQGFNKEEINREIERQRAEANAVYSTNRQKLICTFGNTTLYRLG